MIRRSIVDNINTRQVGSTLSPSPVVLDQRPSALGSPLHGTTTIRRSRLGTSTIAGGVPITNSVIGARSAGVVTRGSRFRASQVIRTPPIVEVTTTPPVVEVTTTPPRVIEVVRPVVEVIPQTVVKKQSRVLTTTTTAPPPPVVAQSTGRLWAKRDRVGAGCPWWCWLLLGLLLLALLLAGLAYLLKDKLFANKDQVVEPIVEPATDNRPEVVEPIVQPAKSTGSGDTGSLPPASDNQGDTQPQTRQPQTEQPQPQPSPNARTATKTPHCSEGSLLYNGRCLRCPPQSIWNGSNCIKKVMTKRKVIEYNAEGESSGDKSLNKQGEAGESSGASSSSSSSTESSSSSEGDQKPSHLRALF